MRQVVEARGATGVVIILSHCSVTRRSLVVVRSPISHLLPQPIWRGHDVGVEVELAHQQQPHHHIGARVDPAECPREEVT